MQNTTKFVGLDVSKEMIAVAVADADRGAPRSLGNIENTPEAIRKLMKKIGEHTNLEVCYEAGPTGYGIYRQLKKMGISCMVVAPSLIPRRHARAVRSRWASFPVELVAQQYLELQRSQSLLRIFLTVYPQPCIVYNIMRQLCVWHDESAGCAVINSNLTGFMECVDAQLQT